jgi:hypothetical protein
MLAVNTNFLGLTPVRYEWLRRALANQRKLEQIVRQMQRMRLSEHV